jgi:hypothetical protein
MLGRSITSRRGVNSGGIKCLQNFRRGRKGPRKHKQSSRKKKRSLIIENQSKLEVIKKLEDNVLESGILMEPGSAKAQMV